ncbi:MAG TPA: hypothetical protein PLT04_01260 [Candidatus Saccharibacteria bacterium]|jgi:hypothetical protein|nr:hypothetical protein [Candidatus Saccharibacteria bacterium]
MNKQAAQAVLDQTLGQIFGYKNPLSLDQFQQKFAFDVRLPQQVVDGTTGQLTWTQSPNPTKFITVENAWKREDWDATPKRELNSIEDVINAWNEVNYTATERYLDSANISESDNIYGSESVYRSLDIHRSKNVIFSDNVADSEYVIAAQRSHTLQYSARVEDSHACSNSFSVIWSKKIVNSFFIEDCADMYESMFCSHITNKKYYIANAQYTEDEYRRIKDMVIRWILTS